MHSFLFIGKDWYWRYCDHVLLKYTYFLKGNDERAAEAAAADQGAVAWLCFPATPHFALFTLEHLCSVLD